MILENRRGAPREGAPLKNAFLAGSEFQNSVSPVPFQASRAAFVLARRFALPISTAATVAALAGIGGRANG